MALPVGWYAEFVAAHKAFAAKHGGKEWSQNQWAEQLALLTGLSKAIGTELYQRRTDWLSLNGTYPEAHDYERWIVEIGGGGGGGGTEGGVTAPQSGPLAWVQANPILAIAGAVGVLILYKKVIK